MRLLQTLLGSATGRTSTSPRSAGFTACESLENRALLSAQPIGVYKPSKPFRPPVTVVPLHNPTKPTNPGTPSGAFNVYDGLSINTAIPISQIQPVLRDLGTQRVRVVYSTSSWDNRRPNQFAIDRAVELKKAGYHVLLTVLSKTDKDKVPAAAQVENYMRWLIKRPGLKQAVDLWQVGNEPNHKPWWKGTLKQYVDNELKPAAKVIRAAGEKVVGAGPTWDVKAADELVRAGYMRHVDYAAFHPYGSSAQQVEERAAGAVKAFKGKPVLFTEWNIRNTPDKHEWARKVGEARERLKGHGDAAYYFALAHSGSMAGPAGLVFQNGSLTKNKPFYDVVKQWKFDRETKGNLLR
jgi:hypothetical protein